MAEQPELRSLKEGDAFAGFLLAQEVAFKTSAKGSEYLELKLADASGDLKAFFEISSYGDIKIGVPECTVGEIQFDEPAVRAERFVVAGAQ